jgi:hypothetical protein
VPLWKIVQEHPRSTTWLVVAWMVTVTICLIWGAVVTLWHP